MIILTAAAVIEAGLGETVVCYRAMNGRSGFRLGGGRDLSAYGITQFTAPYGWMDISAGHGNVVPSST